MKVKIEKSWDAKGFSTAISDLQHLEASFIGLSWIQHLNKKLWYDFLWKWQNHPKGQNFSKKLNNPEQDA